MIAGRGRPATATRSPPASSAPRSARSRPYLDSPERVLHPLARVGSKGSGRFERISWDDGARPRRGRAGRRARPLRRRGDPAVRLRRLERRCSPTAPPTRCSSAGSAPRGWRARSARRPPARAATGLYGKMPGVALPDYRHARLIVVWGCNPSATGIHLVPEIRAARDARRPARGGRSARAPRSPRRPTCTSRRGRAPTSSWRSRRSASCSRSGRADLDFLGAPRGAAPTSCAGAPSRGRSSAPRAVCDVPAADLRALRRRSTPPPRRRWCAAAGASSATATAARRWPRSSRCRRWPASSACAAAATRCRNSGAWKRRRGADRRARAGDADRST